mmetsp:Transcript_3464/g.5518  ORF Transcript_3464/g.5518 Transcript_3464/m.5518 type:complete len:263 (-) Transcript_3464:932-1720(-)
MIKESEHPEAARVDDDLKKPAKPTDEQRRVDVRENNDLRTIAEIGRWSAFLAGILTTIFALALFLDFNSNTGIDFFACFLLPFAYMAAVLSHRYLVTAEKLMLSAFYADLSVLMAILYACYICGVYYLQLTFVRKTTRATDSHLRLAKFVVEYKPGTPIFPLDILGYVLLAVSTIFLALSISKHTADANGKKWPLLINLLYLHGAMGLGSFYVPFLPMIYKDHQDEQDNMIWQTPLISWCVLFAPICFLLGAYFQSHHHKHE